MDTIFLKQSFCFKIASIKILLVRLINMTMDVNFMIESHGLVVLLTTRTSLLVNYAVRVVLFFFVTKKLESSKLRFWTSSNPWECQL